MKRARWFLAILALAFLVVPAISNAGDLSGGAGSVPAAAPAPPSDAATLQANTYYVRTDGGDASQCTGLADAAYPGSGTGQACAWNHPFQALPPGGTARISGGDTLIISTASYMMGYGAAGDDNCDSAYPWDCYMLPVPSGPDAGHPTRILGAGWSSGCPQPTTLWGTERPAMILNLTDSSHVEISCLEITDHLNCAESHTGGLECNTTSYPYGDWAVTGLYAEDSTDVHLRFLNIHGLAHTGIWAARLTDWTLENVAIAGNGWTGWDGDFPGDDSSNSGTLTFRRVIVAWNGCVEGYPDPAPSGCWGQTAGGYGDGLGTGATQGHWIFEDSAFINNTSDGLDLLYARQGSRIEIRRVFARDNAGNQIKTNGPTLIENSIIVGSCGFFNGQSFTYNVDDCRSQGTAVSVDLILGNHVTLTNNTITSEGDCLVLASCDTAQSSCNGSERVVLRSNIFQGQVDFLQPFENTCLVYQETFSTDPFDVDYSLINDVKNDDCPGAHDICGVNPGLASATLDTFDAHLQPSSPAINQALASAAPPVDFDNRPRDANPDIGAYEWRMLPPPSHVYLPTVYKNH